MKFWNDGSLQVNIKHWLNPDTIEVETVHFDDLGEVTKNKKEYSRIDFKNLFPDIVVMLRKEIKQYSIDKPLPFEAKEE